MTDTLIIVALLLLAATFPFVWFVARRFSRLDDTAAQRLEALAKDLERIEKTVREEMGKARDDQSKAGREQRQELSESIRSLGETLARVQEAAGAAQTAQMGSLAEKIAAASAATAERLDRGLAESAASAKAFAEANAAESASQAALRKAQAEDFARRLEARSSESAAGAKALREEVTATIKILGDGVMRGFSELADAQKRRLDDFSASLAAFAKESKEALDASRTESSAQAKALREEVVATLGKISEGMSQTLKDLAIAEKAQLDAFSAQVGNLTRMSGEKLDVMRSDTANASKQLREEVIQSLKGISDATTAAMGTMAEGQRAQLEAMKATVESLAKGNETKLEAVRAAVEERLQALQADNGKQLEQMRLTVDEKLQGTLEKRLGESFKLVSERLELVHKGLGEMQSLATGVGDLKKVLTNVKTRGTWGEVQLGALLEQVLNHDQFERNVATKGGNERVEFAIKLPGQGPEERVWLPIDAKFPVEDYRRLAEAQERADAEGAEAAGRQLETRVKECAAEISKKYLSPPGTTDFGILYLPIEGLFAEVIRRPELVETIQRQHRVVVAGPTTLWSILSSLQMGFRTLAIQRRSGEVWNLLAAVKTEWGKYGEVLDLVKKRLSQAADSFEKVHVRSRAIARHLKSVEALPAEQAAKVLTVERLLDEVQTDDEPEGRDGGLDGGDSANASVNPN